MNLTTRFTVTALGLLILACARSGAAPTTAPAAVDAVDFTTTQVPSDYKAFASAGLGYQVKHPANWTTGSKGQTDLYHGPDDSPTFRANIGVKCLTRRGAEADLTLAQVADISVAAVAKVLQDPQRHVMSPAKHAAGDAYVMIYSGKVEMSGSVYSLKWAQLLISRGEKVWLLTLTTEAPTFDRYWKEIQPLFASFSVEAGK